MVRVSSAPMPAATPDRQPDAGPTRPARALFYDAAQKLTWLLMVLVYRLRVARGKPSDGAPRPIAADRAYLVIANHQSFFDPVIAASSVPRRLTFLARASLFKNRLFAALIRSLNAVPLNDEGSDTAAIRTAIEQLKLGRCVLIFPEGTRTPDGAVHPFKRGCWVLLSRAKCDVLPVGIDGAFEAFPRRAKFPAVWGQRLAARVGDPIDSDKLLAMGPDEGLTHLAHTVDALRRQARDDIRQATHGRWPPTGAGDSQQI